MVPEHFAPGAAALLQAADAGSDAWWQHVAEQGAPLIESTDSGTAWVTFLWRDTQGGADTSSLRRIYIDVNSVTDHHSAQPQSLQRLGDSNVWFWQVELVHNWRGSYCFLPVDAAGVAPEWQGDDAEKRLQQRRWWRSILPLAQADPLNPYHARRDASLSALHLPAAPAQLAWNACDSGTAKAIGEIVEREWNSARLGNTRKIWIYRTTIAVAQPELPLVVLLDGGRWRHDLPVFTALDFETAGGRLPAAVYVLVDAIDGHARERELSCNPAFWQALQAELLPQVAQVTRFTTSPHFSVVAGQSLGGLAAVYAGLHFGQRFGAVLSQSGSFWWPQVEWLQSEFGQPCPRRPGAAGWLARELAQGNIAAAAPLRVFLEVGSREDVMIDLNETLRDALAGAGHAVAYGLFEGGHDALCWRGGLIDGLVQLLADVPRGHLQESTSGNIPHEYNSRESV